MARYRKLHDWRLPEELRGVLVRLENDGLVSPVLFGGSLRDTYGDLKPVNDYDVRSAGFKDPRLTRILESLLDVCAEQDGYEQESFPVPYELKTRLEKKFGIGVKDLKIHKAGLRILGGFSDSAIGTPYLDLSIMRSTFEQPLGKVQGEVLKHADVALSSVCATSSGDVIAHRHFENDAKGGIFRPIRTIGYSDSRVRDYFDRLREKVPELQFHETPFTLTHRFMKAHAPQTMASLIAARNLVRGIKRIHTYRLHRGQQSSPESPVQNPIARPASVDLDQ